MPPSTRPHKGFSVMVRAIVAAIVVTVIVLLVWILLPKQRFVHTRYDQDLGWVNIPNLNIPDAFGKGVSIRTNAQAFRNDREFSIAVPAGKKRVICLGDSYTFAYGVDNDHAWCQQLALLDPRIESVNMGQGAYGIDQAYLWYKRDGLPLDHHLQVFAVIYDDFNRFGKRFLGYEKPVLELHGGNLTVGNIPVPKQSVLQRRMGQIMGTLYQSSKVSRSQQRRLALAVFEDLDKINKGKGGRLAVVYLPTYFADMGHNSNRELRAFLNDELFKRGIPFIDLTDDFARLPKAQIRAMYNINDQKGGHYTQMGNAFVAKLLLPRLSVLMEQQGIER